MRQKYDTIDLGVRIKVVKNSQWAPKGTVWSVGAGCSPSVAAQLVNDGFAEIIAKPAEKKMKTGKIANKSLTAG